MLHTGVTRDVTLHFVCLKTGFGCTCGKQQCLAATSPFFRALHDNCESVGGREESVQQREEQAKGT